jgi:hypothetical protein
LTPLCPRKFRFGRGKNFDAVVVRFEEALKNAEFKANSDEIAMAPMYIGTVPKNLDPLGGIHSEHFNGFRFMLVDYHVFLVSCPNHPHGSASSRVHLQVGKYAESVVPEMIVVSDTWSSRGHQADVSMSRDKDVPTPPLIAGRSIVQPVLVVDVVCSSPTSLFRVLDQADEHMTNNPETAAYIIFYFFKLRADRALAMVAIEGARRCSRWCLCWHCWPCRDSAIHLVWYSHTSLCDTSPRGAHRVLGWRQCGPARGTSSRCATTEPTSGYGPQLPWCRWCRDDAHDRRCALASSRE